LSWVEDPDHSAIEVVNLQVIPFHCMAPVMPVDLVPAGAGGDTCTHHRKRMMPINQAVMMPINRGAM
jgi:hypothetical protein